MGFTDLIRAALDNPEQQANPSDLEALRQNSEQLSSGVGGNPAMSQTLLSTVGSYVRTALQDQRRSRGDEAVQETVQRYGGLGRSEEAVETLFSPQERERVTRSVSQETGIAPTMVQGMLPMLVPMVLKFLQGGAATGQGSRSNPVLSSFLDADRDGDVDIGDALRLVSGLGRSPGSRPW